MKPAAAAVVLLAFASTLSVAAQTITPSTPIAEKPPEWTRSLIMPDGRRWVSDGGLAIEIDIAKPATLPTIVIPPESSKIVLGYTTTPHLQEIGLGQLQAGSRPNTFVSPDGVGVNGNYVTFLRKMAPRARLRFRGARDPVTIMLNGRTVGVLMPVVAPQK